MHTYSLHFGLTTIRLHLAIYFQSPFTGKAIKRLNCSAFRKRNHACGRTIWIVDAHRDDGKRFVGHADELLAAFMELESATRLVGNCIDGFVPLSKLDAAWNRGQGRKL